MLAKFWWGLNAKHRKIHWMSWERLSKAKNDSGMGIRGMKKFNKALLGKHCWRLATGGLGRKMACTLSVLPTISYVRKNQSSS
ncbi:ribonuclease H [Trifolium pratense]|uniref:Ribonuclease H n=1 Tax=Trifolium pratense TaxID=57577 RepID=A0A2K3NRC6_TRIPR|nr:ribonuclease H [Trifolium pratense]